MAKVFGWKTAGGCLVAVLSLTAIACGGGDDEADTPTSDEVPDEETTITTSTQPPGTSPVDVEPYIAELLVRYDDVTGQIVADPGVANDRSHPLVVEYLELVEPGDFADGALQRWVANAAEGVSIRPYDSESPVVATQLDGPIEAVSADEVTFPTCEHQSYRKYDAQGRETEFLTRESVPGRGTAVRVNGRWRLRRLDIATNLVGCRNGAA